jgi:hypothetical protein
MSVSLRSVSEAIRRNALDGSVGTRVAESLLILGLEGSPHGVFTLWRFNLRFAFDRGDSVVAMAHCRAEDRPLNRGMTAIVPATINRCTLVLSCGCTQQIGMSEVDGVHAVNSRIGGERSRICAAVSRSRITIGPAQ